ncbi:MAG: hypothetical protein AUJ92_03730 [Armatimonadetes bacterium CG2_30_59_28]|nr:hypothetical protein [Armatimonadota bacterium]OIO97435.1 MAG: hypothetical protein AUJ92_03730 [Armatimonadetes bacterium CG2_30_59_28]PIU66834.1 MAG: hypothetical protein COS85_03130 [Armatimonadetes bacterium CG07_land_8_20_14_0_80_59_28]PIX44845.1 MAG: hypothetical protein COZ56_03560 [Armatimonadetes bacterium CG_4_8_14_3_um_filter_58_9]PIY39282.1 MAG: hypothetical protein COZ05_19455 [Armatimonadetes bacterium CG_4_10_14_3_um_filter_59_10]PJB78227.1 MAG: hypothetical protein CO095_007
MQTITLHSHVGSDGILKLNVPVDASNADIEVVVVVHPVNGGDPNDTGWPPGFIERTAGVWAGEKLVREPQGEYEVREELR